MLEAMTHFTVEPFAAFFALGQTPTSSDRPRLAQAYILRTSDGRLLAIHLSSLEKFWEGLVAALRAPALSGDPRFNSRQARIDNYESLGAELDRHFSQQSLAHWVDELGRNDVPFAPINTIPDVVNDPQVGHLGLIVPVESPRGAAHAVRPPVQFSGKRCATVRAAPLLDEHGAAIRAALSKGQCWPGELRET
jgi:crotonobetainyl-CoA:carnitine CoA-transferase CaiB-like acyl-CoA transferase